MNLRLQYSPAILILAATVWAQQDQPRGEEKRPADQQQGQSQQQQAPQRRPTLGPAPAPSLYGPRTSNTTDARKLLRVRNIFVERIDNSLGEKLMEGLAKTRRFHIVADRKEADAVIRGTCFDQRRLKIVRSEVYLNDTSGASIWQDSVRRPFNPPTLDAAVGETATLILSHLTESVSDAEHK
ncbi:MAG: hypothetical protein ACE145_19195 [Terriglobia bacterium]